MCSSSVYLSRTLRQAGREASGPHGPTQTTRLLSPQYNIYTYGIHTQIYIYIYHTPCIYKLQIIGVAGFALVGQEDDAARRR